MRRTITTVILLAAIAGGDSPPSALAQRPPGVEALLSARAARRASAIASPRLRLGASPTLLLAFVAASGARPGERVRAVSGGGLRWTRVASGDGGGGAVEVWQARSVRPLAARVVALLSAPAYPASITIAAYAGAGPYVAAHAGASGSASVPRLALRPVAGSLVWIAGLGVRQRQPLRVSLAARGRRLISRADDWRRRTGAWVQLLAVRSRGLAGEAGVSWARAWNVVAVDVVVPALKRSIEEGRLTAFGAAPAASAAMTAGPPGGGGPPRRYRRTCPAYPAFEVGVQDDPVFLGLQPAMSPARGFELATTVFHARLLRLNVVWGEVKLYGWGPYDRAIQMARERCWAVHLTIMPTPTYAERYLPSELSARHLDLALFASFASAVATRYAGEVRRYALGNEPDEGKFMLVTGNLSEELERYDRMYMAGYDAVKAADPGAQVIAGELAGKDTAEWVSNAVTLPCDGVSIHPYAFTKGIAKYVKAVAPLPLLVSEDGVRATDPEQIPHDLEREEVARLAGATEFIFFQLSRADTTERFEWNTGIE